MRRSGVIAAVSVVCLLASSASASGGATHFESGHKSGVYLFLTVSHGTVTKARWRVKESCADSAPESNSGVDVLNAPIRNGRFHKSVTQTHGNPGEPNGGWTDTTSFRGTVTGTVATVKVTDNFFVASTSPCFGVRTFTATITAHLH